MATIRRTLCLLCLLASWGCERWGASATQPQGAKEESPSGDGMPPIVNIIHCGAWPKDVKLTRAERTRLHCEFALRMAYEWVGGLPDKECAEARRAGLKALHWWSGAGYWPDRADAFNVEYPKWIALDSAQKPVPHGTMHSICVQSAEARRAAIEEFERTRNWNAFDGVGFDSTSHAYDCHNPAHTHDCATGLEGKAKLLAAFRAMMRRHGKSLVYNPWSYEAWKPFLARPDYDGFRPDSFMIESGPWSEALWGAIPADRCWFQWRDERQKTLGWRFADYLATAGLIASHGGWGGYQGYYAEDYELRWYKVSADPPMFYVATAAMNLLHALPNWDNLNGARKRRFDLPPDAGVLAGAKASSALPTYQGRGPQLAIDGITSEYGWTGQGKTGELEVELPQPRSVRRVELFFYAPAVRAIDYRVQVFSGAEWTTCAEATGNESLHPVHILDKPVTAQKLRYCCLRSAHPGNIYLQEVKLYDDARGLEGLRERAVYSSEFSYVDRDVVRSVHPKSGKVFLVFDKTGVWTDLGKPVGSVRRANNRWEDVGDGAADLQAEGSRVMLKNDSGKGVGYIIGPR